MPTISQPYSEKITIVRDRVVVAGTGAIGLGQRFTAITDHGWKNDKFKNKTAIQIGEYLAQEALQNFSQTGINPPRSPHFGGGGNPESYGALVAMPSKEGHSLIEFPASSFQPEIKTDKLWYASMGSGQKVGDPLLGVIRAIFWEDHAPPTCQEGIFAATMILKLGFGMADSGVRPPIQMAVLRGDPKQRGQLLARRLTGEELAEHEQSVDNAIIHFREYRDILRGIVVPAQTLPEPPTA